MDLLTPTKEMDHRNENQHHISQVLLKRFKISGEPLQCYQIDSGEWIPKSVERACAARGYNVLVADDFIENSLDDEFSKVESKLPGLFRVLEKAAESESTALSLEDFSTLCRYAAILKGSSLVTKGHAVVNLVLQINWELEHGKADSLREMQLAEAKIAYVESEFAKGQRVIIDAQNAMQMLYRRRFAIIKHDIWEFSQTGWSVLTSPIDLPLSDVGLFPLTLTEIGVHRYVLPISPRLILRGTFYFDQSKNSAHQPVKSAMLSTEDAQEYFDFLCASSVFEIICSRRLSGIPEAIQRAEANGISFQRFVRKDDIKSAGQMNSSFEVNFRLVDQTEYRAFIGDRLRLPDTKAI